MVHRVGYGPQGPAGAAGAAGPTGPTGPTGPAGGGSSLNWSTADYWSNSTASTLPVEAAGNFSTGMKIICQSALTITGVRFYKAGATPRTIRCTLWDATGAALATVDVSTTAAGYYTGTFGAPVTLSAAQIETELTVSIWETSGSVYYRNSGYAAQLTTDQPIVPFRGGPKVVIVNNGSLFLAGNNRPTTVAGTERYAVEPVIA